MSKRPHRPLEPLAPGSLEAETLHRLWSGERIVHLRSLTPSVKDRRVLDRVIQTVVAQLRMRARFDIAVVSDDRRRRSDLYLKLKALIPAADLYLDDAAASQMAEPANRIDGLDDIFADDAAASQMAEPANRIDGLDDIFADFQPGVSIRPHFHHAKWADPYDLVVVTEEHSLDNCDLLVSYLMGGKQMLVIGPGTSPAKFLHLDDRTDLDVPLDVALAGGVG